MSQWRRFVVLEHDHPFLHWDLMLEHSGVLQTWRLLQAPQAGEWISAERLPDHRLHYLDFEGPVSGNRGHVHRTVAGEFQTPTTAEAPDQSFKFQLRNCSVGATLTRRESHDGVEWKFDD